MILIYTHTLTPRVAYTIDLVFRSVLNTEYRLTDDLTDYTSTDLPKLAYTKDNPGSGVFIEADELLFETHSRTEKPQVIKGTMEFPVFFKTKSDSFLSYDLFATVFYIATRYEEYLPYNADKHGRYRAEESLLFKHDLLKRPFLNDLIIDFSNKLKHHFPTLEFKKRAFNFLSTIDIDNAFAYAHKGFTRNLGGLLKDGAFGRFNKLSERFKSNRNDTFDPYNTFDLINALSKDTQTALQYFVLIGDHATYDKNPHHDNPSFRKLLKALAVNHSIGLHPSYESYNAPEKIEIEKNRLEAIIERKVTSARCHFLRIKFPDTYRHFMNAGITDDYTMIYASQSGFRTGLCVPYPWFDLEKNEATNLTIHTSVVMEGTLRDYNQLSVKQAEEVALDLMHKVKQQGGEFISIFHNDSFVAEQKPWVELYKTILKQSKH